MKRFALVLAVVLFGAACTDVTAPATHSLSVPTPPSLLLQGNLPPPPADAVIDVTVYSFPIHGVFTGVYFANGASVEAQAAAIELGDPSLNFLGTAWLRFDNNQALGTSATANARFQLTDQKFFGTGTLVIVQLEDGVPVSHTIKIDEVTKFVASPTCGPGDLCADIEFYATVDGDPGIPRHYGHAVAFVRSFCTIDCLTL